MLAEKYTQGKVVCTDSSMNINVTIDSSTGETMSLYEFSRWNCLLEAVDIIDQKAKQIKHMNSNWVKPIAIQKYIDERTHSMIHEIAIDRGVKEEFKPA